MTQQQKKLNIKHDNNFKVTIIKRKVKHLFFHSLKTAIRLYGLHEDYLFYPILNYTVPLTILADILQMRCRRLLASHFFSHLKLPVSDFSIYFCSKNLSWWDRIHSALKSWALQWFASSVNFTLRLYVLVV